jgi:catechol 2,3-dioxygenase-like lactoylglutathione lyase family enzyme
MSHRGISHIGLSTLDLDKTRTFYRATLLFQMGILDHPLAAAGADSAVRLLKLR